MKISIEEDLDAAMRQDGEKRLRQAEARGELIRRDPYVEALFGRYKPPRRKPEQVSRRSAPQTRRARQ